MDQNESPGIAPLTLTQTYQMKAYSSSRFKLKGKISKTLLNKKHLTEAATGGVLQEKVFLEISQNSQENTSASVSF